MAARVTERSSARDRLLAAANELFYKEGVHTVGIDRVIERAGVAKASLYSTFGSKDELICTYLRARHEVRRTKVAEALAAHDTPRDRVLAIFDVLADVVADPGYHGCPFLNASAEASADSPILDVTQDYRDWMRQVFSELAAELDVAAPEVLAQKLMMIYDGANVSARLDRAVGPAANAAVVARATAATLLDGITASTTD